MCGEAVSASDSIEHGLAEAIEFAQGERGAKRNLDPRSSPG